MSSAPTAAAPSRSGARPAGGVDRTPRTRWQRAFVLGAPLAATLGLLVALALGGAAAPEVLADPGAFVRWGLPALTGVRDLAMALTIGALLLAAAVLPARSPAWGTAARTAAVASGVWTLCGVAVLVLTAASVAGVPLQDPTYGGQLGTVVRELTQGQALVVAAVLVALVATAAIGIRTPAGAGWTLALALLALVPLSLNAHSGSNGSHETAVSSWGLHVVGVGAWFGGLAALALVARGLGRDTPAVARRFSAVAGWAFVLVVASGVANASVRIASFAELVTTGYGRIVLLKTAASVLLGLAGWWHRRRLLAGLDVSAASGSGLRAPFWRLVAGEGLLFAAVTGLAAALSLTAPPVPQELPPDPTPAELLTGEALPAPFSASSLVTQWSADVLWITICLGLVVGYVTGARRLRARGDRWSRGRTAAFLAGVAVLAYVTSGAPAAYGQTMFSLHMVQHMVLTMAVPLLLVLGAPMTLALRAVPRRRDGSRGLREWLVALTESRWLHVVSHPVVAAVLFAGSLFVFYYSPLFELALSTHVGHELMAFHFLAVGYLFCNAIIGVDPGPSRPSYPMRMVLLLGTMAFHAFFGVAIMQATAVIAQDWFSSTGWGIDILADQRTGGGIAWSIGELPTLALVVAVAVQWSRSDTREARRRDRAADRDGDAELEAYNAMLAQMQERATHGGGARRD